MACRSQSGQEYVSLHLAKIDGMLKQKSRKGKNFPGFSFFIRIFSDSVIAALSGRMT